MKRSPREIIESEKDSRLEHGYVKFPGQEMTPAALKISKDSVEWDDEKSKKIRTGLRRHYTEIHTHPYNLFKYTERKINEGSPLPSVSDLRVFLKDDNAKTMAIAQQNQDNGKVEGYFVLRKTKKTQPVGFSPADTSEELKQRYFSEGLFAGIKKAGATFLNIIGINKTAKKWGKVKTLAVALDEPEYLAQGIEKIAKKYNLQYRFVSAKGYQTDEDKTKFTEKYSGLERKIEGVITFFSLSFGFLFLSSNVTGNAVVNMTISNSNFLGVGFLIVGLVAGFFWLKKR